MLRLIKDIFLTIIRAFPDGLVIGILITMAITLIKEKSLKGYITKLNDRKNRFYLYFIAYTYMILYRTVIGREKIYQPLIDIWGGWKIVIFKYSGLDYGTLIGNVLMFVAFAIAILVTFKSHFKNNKQIIVTPILLSLIYSLIIEASQLIFSRGTFQISDLVYNTIGGLIGSGIYLLISKKERSIR